MKKLTIFIFLLCCVKGFSQDKEKSINRWNFKIGVNIVDNRGKGELFGGLTRTDQSAFGKLPLTAGLERRFSDLFGIEAIVSINSWEEGTGVIDGVTLPNPEGYYSLDINGKLYLDEWLKFGSDTKWLELYASAGLGRFTINKGTFTINYGGGASIWLSERVGLDFNTTIKNALNASEIYETSHFVYSMGLIIDLSQRKKIKKKKEKKEVAQVKDTDSDGVPDDKDYCINSAGFPENNGCPYSDSDGDGMVDKADHCPQIKGYPSHNGCPAPKKLDKVVEVVEAPLEDLATVTKRIKFESGNYNFTQDTYPYLIDLAKILINEPSNTTFKVVGHTDSSGSYEANRALSERRASAVRNYLVDSGIPKRRIEISGLGESDPIDTNLTAEGRANNRRVEIIIVK